MTDSEMIKTYIDTVHALYPLISDEGANKKLFEVKGFFPDVFPRLGLVKPGTKEIVCNARGTAELERVLDSLMGGTEIVTESAVEPPMIRGSFVGEQNVRVCGLVAGVAADITVLSIKGSTVFSAHSETVAEAFTLNTPKLAAGVYLLSIMQNGGRVAVPVKK